jgi:hypothetical protein
MSTLSIAISAILFSTILAIFTYKFAEDVFSPVKQAIKTYTLSSSGMVSFEGKDLNDLGGRYAFKMPVANLKAGDSISLSYSMNRNRLTGIREVFVNGKSVTASIDGKNLPISLVEIL